MGDTSLVEVIAHQASRLVQILNDSLRLANESKNISTRVSRLALARSTLAQLQDITSRYSFVSLTNLIAVQDSIEAVAIEIELARQTRANLRPATPRKRKRRAINELLPLGPEAGRLLREISFSVIDLETTGLSAKAGARIVELAIVRVDPGQSPRVVLDTLVNPQGPVYCTEIHGIADDDVVGAPIFADIVGDAVAALEGTLVGAFNASFDMSFIAAEASSASNARGLRTPPPHVCLMWLRPLLNLGKRCSLVAACEQHGVQPGGHRAAADAMACALLWPHYVEAAERLGIRTLGDLARAGTHKYLATLGYPFYGRADFEDAGARRATVALKPREVGISVDGAGIREYWHALVAALVDGVVVDAERVALIHMRESSGLSREHIRSVHARVYADRLREAAEDDSLTDEEVGVLTRLRDDLAVIGWAP